MAIMMIMIMIMTDKPRKTLFTYANDHNRAIRREAQRLLVYLILFICLVKFFFNLFCMWDPCAIVTARPCALNQNGHLCFDEGRLRYIEVFLYKKK